MTPGIHWDWSTASGRPFQYFACGAAVAEVEVDGYNGMHRVLGGRVQDVGDSLNAGVDLGQIEGAIVQGVGWLTREELLWNKEGRLLTHSASTYQIPAISDAPIEMDVTLLPLAKQDGTIHGSKASGEPPFMLAFSVREALRDAVKAFGTKGRDCPGVARHLRGDLRRHQEPAVLGDGRWLLDAVPLRSGAGPRC
jgi:xanthine dehydrogenase molybdopterin-binding subunit B